ncbi:MAG: methylenetetrahydrofolate reductase [Deltaproteobacteria bacterium]|nr:methylenetetrahydrofolate reductase [Deltaproteobacteria bacterium]
MNEKSKLHVALEAGTFAITAEICPPRGTDTAGFIEKARLLKDEVVAANVTDNQRAVMRLSSLAASTLLIKEGVEPVFQITCRDRNRLAIQSDMLGAWTLGIKNVLALTGDHVSYGDHRGAKAVFDLDAVQLVSAIEGLNQGVNMQARELRGGTNFYLGAVVSPAADPFEPEWIRFEKKKSAGARFFQTQAIYDMDSFKSFFDDAEKKGVKILGGILLLKSAKMARFLNANVPGVAVPEALIQELEDSTDELEKGIEIAARQVRILRGYCHGAHIMAISQEESVPKIIGLS